LAFWFLDVKGALLWGLVMAFLSLLPAVGAALVWLPVAVYFLLTGALWQGAALIAWGVLVIGLVDNLLRPILVGKDTRLPDYVVLMTTLGAWWSSHQRLRARPGDRGHVRRSVAHLRQRCSMSCAADVRVRSV